MYKEIEESGPFSPPSPLPTQSELDTAAQTPPPPTQNEPETAAQTPTKVQKEKKLPSPIIYGSKDDPPKKSIHDQVGNRHATPSTSRGTPETSIKDRLGVRPDSTRSQEGARRLETSYPRRSQRNNAPPFQRGCAPRIMAIRVVEFSNGVYKIRKIFA